MLRVPFFLVSFSYFFLVASCGGTGSTTETAGSTTSTTGSTADDAAAEETAGDSGDTGSYDAPAEAEALVTFLDAGGYTRWSAEPEYHGSDGPHGDGVKVFYSPRAVAGLETDPVAFPEGAAVVKELTSQGFLYGWAVWVKVQPESAAGNGFYWYELIRAEDEDLVYGDGLGSPDCVGCHSAGEDFLLSEGL